jgi:hypothetical protein
LEDGRKEGGGILYIFSIEKIYTRRRNGGGRKDIIYIFNRENIYKKGGMREGGRILYIFSIEKIYTRKEE